MSTPLPITGIIRDKLVAKEAEAQGLTGEAKQLAELAAASLRGGLVEDVKAPGDSLSYSSTARGSQAASEANSLRVKAVGAVTTAHLAGIAAEAASLGQIENVSRMADAVMHATGLPAVAQWVAMEKFKADIGEHALQYWRGQSRATLPDPRTLSYLYNMGGISAAQFNEFMGRWGFPSAVLPGMLEQGQATLGIGELFALKWRGAISDQQLTTHLGVKGFSTAWRSLIPRLLEQYPGYSDTIRIYVREGYQSMKQTEFPASFATDMSRIGYSATTARQLWGAHWVLPSRGELAQMLHRGLITSTTFSSMLKELDYEPRWRSPLERLTYDLPGDIRTRWMFEFGMITRTDMINLHRQRGMDPAWAQKVADAEIANLYRAEINRVRTQEMAAFSDGIISEMTLRMNLQGLPIPAGEVNYLVEAAKIQQERNEKRELTQAAITAFNNWKKSEDWLRQQLMSIGLQSWKINSSVKIAAARRKATTGV